jgi:hypothetical protein
MSTTIEIPLMKEFSFDPLKILARLACGGPRPPAEPRIMDLIGEEIRRASDLISILTLAAEVDRGERPDFPVFKGAAKTDLCICTIGEGIEKTQAQLMAEGHALRAFVLDSLGSDAVLSLCRRCSAFLARRALEAGFRASGSYAPGCPGWNLADQAYIFSVLPAADIGVRLTESFMMIPRKSASFGINLYAEALSPLRRG